MLHQTVDISTGLLMYQIRLFDKETKTQKLKTFDSTRNAAKAVILNVIYKPTHDNKIEAVNFFTKQYIDVSTMLIIKNSFFNSNIA